MRLYILFAYLLLSVSSFAEETSDKKVLICGVCKDVEPALKNTIKSIEMLGERFQDYAVLIYENNSQDHTVKNLREWAARNEKVVLMTHYLTKEQLIKGSRCSKSIGVLCREEMIARARNRVLAKARLRKYNDFEYLIMGDLDFLSQWPVDEIVKSTKIECEWDCISANGITKNKNYWDRYAFRNEEFPFGPELLGKKWWENLRETPFRLEGEALVPVFSAFGGLAIYKRATIIQFSYSGSATDDLKQDYQNILPLLSQDNSHLQEYLRNNEKYQNIEMSLMPIRFVVDKKSQESCGKFPIVCEHVTLHAAMRLKGFGKFYINPKMIIKYPH